MVLRLHHAMAVAVGFALPPLPLSFRLRWLSLGETGRRAMDSVAQAGRFDLAHCRQAG
jgi:hypothetical protein